MFTKKILVIGLAFLMCLGLVFAIAIIAQAQSGGAGTLVDPNVIGNLPFSDSVDTMNAGVGPNDPTPSCGIGMGERVTTRWYTFTPVRNMKVRLSVSSTNYDVTDLTVFTTGGNGGLNQFSCNPPDGLLTLADGQMYYFMLSGYIMGGYMPPWLSMGFNLVEALPPTNDNFANAQPITTLPFNVGPDTLLATIENSEPSPSCFGGQPIATVWYAYTATTNNLLKVTPGGFTAVYTGDSLASLHEVACAGFWWSPVTFRPQAGNTYYIQSPGNDWWGGTETGFSLEELPPPANDNFANAEVVSALPLNVSMDFTAATIEPSEPTPTCLGGQDPGGSVWYAYTPPTNDSLVISQSGTVSVYTGSSLGSLAEVACGTYGNSFTFRPHAGTIYYIRAQSSFRLDLTPPLIVNMSYSPGDPSVYDSVTLSCNCSGWEWNWAWYGAVQSIHWDFGDGSVADGPDISVSHTYKADGDYTANLSLTTDNGSTATASVVVPVRTHDVAIKSFNVPQQIKAGQKHKFVVTIANTHYPESVKVELYKYTSAGFTLFAALVQDVPTGKTTDFTFNYIFPSNDGVINSFQAVATLIGYRDAVPGNNEITVGDQSALKDWTIYSGVWGVVNGQMTNIPTSSGPENFIWAGNKPLTTKGDLTASFNLKLVQPNCCQLRFGGIMFFASAPTMRGDPNMNGYTIEWNETWWEGLKLVRWDHGQPVSLYVLGLWALSNPPSQWVVKVQGDSIRFYGDNVLLFEVKDNTYRSGYFGFFAESNMTIIEANNVQISNKFSSLMIK